MADLVVSDVTKAFGEKTVLQDVSIRIQDHELVSLLGVSGGGKTTLFNVISGLLTPDRGRCSWMGKISREFRGKSAICYKRICFFHTVRWRIT